MLTLWELDAFSLFVLGCARSSSLSMVVPLVPLLKPLLLSGYMIGYLVQPKKEMTVGCTESVRSSEDSVPPQTGAAPLMNWNKVKKLLADRVTTADFERLFR